MKRTFMSIIVCALTIVSAAAQNYSFSDRAQQYNLSDEGDKKVVTGFVSFSRDDQSIFANSLLWAIENISPKERENLKDINFDTNSFSANLTLASEEDSKLKNTYFCKLKVRVNEKRLVFYISDITIQSTVLIAKKITSMDKLQPAKKTAHQEIIDDFVGLESKVLNSMFDFVDTKTISISHLAEIRYGKPKRGMNEDECKLAFGKPNVVLEANGEVQWAYNSSFYLFFRNGILTSFIK